MTTRISRLARVRTAVALVVVAVALGVASPSTARPSQVDPAAGLELLARDSLSPRLTALRFFSPALGREVGARVLTPAGFDPAHDRLPVLWLLHGGFGSSADWTTAGGAEDLTAGLPMVVVMPDAGIGGWYADWRTATAEGAQRWETFHIGELLPYVEEHYGTRTDRAGRAIVGLSMGGFGAMHYAARHPDLFGFAAAFSGAVDLLHPGVSGVVTISPLAHLGFPGDIFGLRLLDETRWRAHNPVDLAANLRAVTVELRTGNGRPGGPHGGGHDIQEIAVSQATATLHGRLAALGIPHLYDDYGPGAHTWDYWRDDLEATLPAVAAAFAAPPSAPPATADHVAFEPTFSVWGFDVALNRPVLESATLTTAPHGFDLKGTGSGVVTTPAWFAPGQVVRVTTTGSGAGVVDLVAGGDGRVRVPVNLGAASRLDEYPRAALLPVPKRTAHVTVAPAAG